MQKNSTLGVLRSSLFGRLKRYFITGILVAAPALITFYVIASIVTYLDNLVVQFLPPNYYPGHYLPFSVPGLGVVAAIFLITFVGALATGILGRSIVRLYEAVFSRLPIVRGVYNASKQAFTTLLSDDDKAALRQVVFVPFPNPDQLMLGFITGNAAPVLQRAKNFVDAEKYVSVFIPFTPTPISGYLLYLPENKLIPADISVDDAFKLIISGGIVSPDQPARK